MAGQAYNGSDIIPQVVHFDGTAWSQVSVPTYYGTNVVYIHAQTDDDVWIAGYSTLYRPYPPFFAHWDGTKWTIAPLPPPLANSKVTAALVRGPYTWLAFLPLVNNAMPQIFEASGTGWQPNPLSYLAGTQFTTMTGTSRDDVFAAAASLSSAASTIFMWNRTGSTWRAFPSPFQSSSVASLSARSAGDLWALLSVPANGLYHWNGLTWTQQSLPLEPKGTTFAQVAGNSTWGYTWLLGNVPQQGVVALYDQISGKWYDARKAPPIAGYFSDFTSISPIASTNEAWISGYAYSRQNKAAQVNLAEEYACVN